MTYQTDLQDANTHLQNGNFKRCLKSALSAARKSPRSAVAINIAGIASGALGKPREAIKHFQKAIALQADYPEAHRNLAQTLILMGRFEDGLTLLNKQTLKRPEDWQAWYLKAQAELGLGHEKSAMQSTDIAIGLQPKSAALYHLRSTINQALGQLKDAICDLENALQVNPTDITALTNLSLPLARCLRSQDALATVEKAVELDPSHMPARLRLGTQLVEMGRTAQGIDQFRAALELDKGQPFALEQLANALPKDEIADLEPQVRKALKTAPKPSEDRASLLFAMAKILATQGDRGQAAKMLAAANGDLSKLTPYDPVSDGAMTKAILARFPDRLQVQAGTQSTPSPIFVLGLPRSGTTLVEATLGAHPDIAALGELGSFGFLLRDTIEQGLPFTQDQAAEMARVDQTMLPDLPAGATAYVDKMPENYRLVGFLKMAYPGCRIINVNRDPRDIALSMWKSHFSGPALAYTYDWGWMAAKFNLYAQSMAHWRHVLPDQILDVRYEDLVADIDSQTRKIAQFCDLAWTADMTRPELNKTQILTLSATQLRQPVHSNSIGKWHDDPSLPETFTSDLDQALWGDYLVG